MADTATMNNMNGNVSVELVKVEYSGQRPAVLGRDLHQALGIKTAYKDWFPRMCEYGFEEGRDFILLPAQKRATNNPKNPWTEVNDHQLTIEMAKEICMIQRTEIGKRCREYFIEIEKRYNEQSRALTPAEFLLEQAKMLVEQERRMAMVESKVYSVETDVSAMKIQVNDLETKFEAKLNPMLNPTVGMDWYTITGYIALNKYRVNPNDYEKLGKAAARLSREKGYPIGQAPHPTYGHVGVYNSDILSEVFKCYEGKW